ncbi:hypothetical protein V1525DRAFT_396737 [Lipomyces kononenkoae]|uniref:Uncharacterized protein n=1 Tax=Lipomyces kononenkoae TaxID=34357 RepID=A0ACC3T7W7_LIPKO
MEIDLDADPAARPAMPKSVSDAPEQCRATFFRNEKGQYILQHCQKFENSLLSSVGLLELANAGDFAANVWNEIPVPKFAAALMAVGATTAGLMTFVAVWDGRLSWRNIQLLRKERRYLLAMRNQPDKTFPLIDALLEVNRWELGTEFIDRLAMDVLMGLGCLLVSAGTYMAIGGANPTVYHASNLLSGYIGNSPAALGGLIIAVWCIYVLMRAQKHGSVPANAVSRPLLRRRKYLVQLQSSMNGTTGLVSGLASMLTSTRWYGYVILIPCICIFVFCNYLWRKQIGYNRKSIEEFGVLDESSLVEELAFISHLRMLLTENTPGRSLIHEGQSPTVLLELIAKSRLFESFCSRLLENTDIASRLGDPGGAGNAITIELSHLFVLAAQDYSSSIVEIAQECIIKDGPALWRDRERHLVEVLGSYMSCYNEKEEIECK